LCLFRYLYEFICVGLKDAFPVLNIFCSSTLAVTPFSGFCSSLYKMVFVVKDAIHQLAFMLTYIQFGFTTLQNTDECRMLLKEDHELNEHEGARAHRSLHDFAERNYLARLSTVRTKR